MAGLGFKDFQVGEVLTSSDVDGYLMQQTVMRFADSAARGSALGTAVGTGVALAEGMVTYLDDVNQVQVFDGASWKTSGRILQVVSTTKTDTFSTSASGYTSVTGLSVSITPALTSSNILLLANVNWMYSDAGTGASASVSVFRDGTNLVNPDLTSGRADAFDAGNLNSAKSVDKWIMNGNFHIYDAPATTSSVTYDIRVYRSVGTVYVNGGGAWTDHYSVSTITAIEVAG